jgi:hypothetical protein
VAQQRGSAVEGGVGAGSCVLIFELMQSIQAACRVVVRSDDREGFGRPCAQRDLVSRVGIDAELVRPKGSDSSLIGCCVDQRAVHIE